MEANQTSSSTTVINILSIGHSTHTWTAFCNLLNAHRVTHLVDVRSHPGSRKYPHFSRQAMEVALPQAVPPIQYTWAPGLGGFRHGETPGPTTWTVASFAQYFTYAARSNTFPCALEWLIEQAQQPNQVVAYMCSEAVYWRCHRRIISDALSSRGINVMHIMNEHVLKAHEPTIHANFKPEWCDDAHHYECIDNDMCIKDLAVLADGGPESRVTPIANTFRSTRVRYRPVLTLTPSSVSPKKQRRTITVKSTKLRQTRIEEYIKS